MPVIDDEEHQIRLVEAELYRRFEGSLSRDRICAEVADAAADLYAGARVRAFIPVLVQRRVTERLRTSI